MAFKANKILCRWYIWYSYGSKFCHADQEAFSKISGWKLAKADEVKWLEKLMVKNDCKVTLHVLWKTL